MILRTLLLAICSMAIILPLNAQFIVNGSASSSGSNCYVLTQNLTNQSGSVWYATLIDLTETFEFDAEIFLGCNNGGADGMVFAFQSVSTSTGSSGGGLGYQGISPSIGVEFDTWQNGGSGDPFYDHMAIISQGSVDHNAATNLAGPVGILPGNANAEDCSYHALRVSWNPLVDSLKIYIDCDLKLVHVGDIVNTIFAGDSLVYWGFTGSTGAAFNLQQFCYDFVSFGLDTTICQGDTLPLNAGPGLSYSWSPATGLDNTTSGTPLAFPDTTTAYEVAITDSCGFLRTELFTITVISDSLLDIELGPYTTLCPGDTLIAGSFRPGVSYLWQDGSTDSIFNITGPGLYWIELANSCGTFRDSIHVLFGQPPFVDLGNDTLVCDGGSFTLDGSHPEADTYLWQDGSISPTLDVSAPGLYWVEISNACGTSSDSITVVYETPLTPISLGRDTLLCDGASFLLDMTQTGNVNYLWHDGTTANQFLVNQSGAIWVEISNACNAQRDTIEISTDQSPVVDLGMDSTLCEGETLTLDASWTPTSSYQWQDNSGQPTFLVQQPGIFSVIVTNACGTDSDQVTVDFLAPPPSFNLGRDTTLCDGTFLQISTGLSGYAHLWHDGATQNSYQVNQPGTFSVEVSNICGTVSDQIQVNYLSAPVVDLGENQILCEGGTVTLDVTWSDATYLWNDNSILGVRTLTEGGTYSVTVSNICGNASDEILLDVKEGPDPFSLGEDRILCEGDSLVLNIFQGDFHYLWQNGSLSSEFIVDRPGLYRGQVDNECGIVTDEIFVEYLPSPSVDLGNDTLICSDKESTILLDATFLPQPNYRWSTGQNEPKLVVDRPGNYSVELENQCGLASDSINISPTPCFCAIHAPTGFTPNGDGYNDQFRAFYACELINGTLKIFNRWGQLVFQSVDLQAEWDGTQNGNPVAEGVYVWVIEYRYELKGRRAILADPGYGYPFEVKAYSGLTDGLDSLAQVPNPPFMS